MALSAGPGFELRVAYEAAREETRYRADGAYVEDKAAQASASCLSEGLSQQEHALGRRKRRPASVNQSLGARWPRPAGCAGRPGGLGFDRGTVPQRTRSESAGVAKGEPCRSATSASAWDPIAHTSTAVCLAGAASGQHGA